jgi:hypothetical protein
MLMLAAMRAVRIPVSGPVAVIELAHRKHGDTRAFLDGLYAAIGCQSVECVELTTAWDLWLDETGMVNGRVINHRATQLARSCGLSVHLFGDVVVTGTNDDLGRAVALTDDQTEALVRRILGCDGSADGGEAR